MEKPKGVTVLINMSGLTLYQLVDIMLWKEIAMGLSEFVGLTAIKDSFMLKVFSTKEHNPSGLTFSLVLAESHLCGHSWGETGYIRLELSSCKQVMLHQIRHFLKGYFPESNIEMKEVAW